MVDFYRQFGVNIPIGSQIKIWGGLYFLDVIVLVVTGMIITMFNGWFANCSSNIPYLVFSISTALLAAYLLLRPHTNPGKRNFQMLIFTFLRTPHFFKSINNYSNRPIRFRSLDERYAKRLPLSQHYRGSNDHRGV